MTQSRRTRVVISLIALAFASNTAVAQATGGLCSQHGSHGTHFYESSGSDSTHSHRSTPLKSSLVSHGDETASHGGGQGPTSSPYGDRDHECTSSCCCCTVADIHQPVRPAPDLDLDVAAYQAAISAWLAVHNPYLLPFANAPPA